MRVTTNTHTESDDGKNSRNKNLSDNEIKLQQLDRRDNTFKGFLLVILVCAVGFNAVSAIQFRNETRVARAANIARQNEIQDYIKCIVLLKFYEPPLTPNSTKAETIAALDTCSKQV